MRLPLTLLAVLLLTAVGCLAAPRKQPAPAPAKRDPWLWPFSADSIWNTPIGAKTVYRTVWDPPRLDPIRHVVKINPYAARYCYYSQAIPGWRWPACKADSYAAKDYKGTNPAVVMGSLLALPPDATPGHLGIRTKPGQALFHVLQDYGAYFTEDAHWDTWDLVVERDAEKEFEREHGFSMKSEKWRDEVNWLMSALQVVDNNGPKSIGGGGKPRQPLAPRFAK